MGQFTLWPLHFALFLSLASLALVAAGLLAADIPAALQYVVMGGALLISGGVVMLYALALTVVAWRRASIEEDSEENK